MDACYIAAMKQINNIGDATIKQMLDVIPSGEKLWNLSLSELKDLKILNEAKIQSFMDFTIKNPDLPEKIYKACQKGNIKTVTITDENYPFLLKHIHQPPAMLFYKGTLPESDAFNIAMVGSRKFTAYGKEAAEMIAEDLVNYGINVISGAARGIDSASHRGALRGAPGTTVAVLGCGIDIVYPAENRKLFNEILEKNGAIISEYPPGTNPYPAFFPARNRIISGMSKGVIVVEAGRKSGALITADLAFNENREVFAVPGSIFSRMSDGPNWLIKENEKNAASEGYKIRAHVLTSAEDILYEFRDYINFKTNERNKYSQKNKLSEPELPKLPDMTEDELLVYQMLSDTVEMSTDEIYASMPSHVSIGDISTIMLNLTIKGIIRQTESNNYIRVERS